MRHICPALSCAVRCHAQDPAVHHGEGPSLHCEGRLGRHAFPSVLLRWPFFHRTGSLSPMGCIPAKLSINCFGGIVIRAACYTLSYKVEYNIGKG
jgi:hypothetical protein